MIVIHVLTQTSGGAEQIARNIFKNSKENYFDSYIIYMNNPQNIELKNNEFLINKYSYNLNIISYLKTIYLTIKSRYNTFYCDRPCEKYDFNQKITDI